MAARGRLDASTGFKVGASAVGRNVGALHAPAEAALSRLAARLARDSSAVGKQADVFGQFKAKDSSAGRGSYLMGKDAGES